jgi:hypothetical protein
MEEVTFHNASLSDCLKFAYGIVSNAQIAGPDWINLKAGAFRYRGTGSAAYTAGAASIQCYNPYLPTG